MIEVRVKPTRLLFFNEEDYYGIYGVEVNTEDLIREEELKVNKYGNISIKGYMHKLNLYEEYTVRIKPDSDGKYEGSYILESIKSKKPNTIEEQKTFLSSILTPFQIENIYEVYKEEDDILGLIETGMFDYKKIKGMGDKTFESIKEKIMNNMDMSEILSFCAKYDIKYNQIAKLVRELKNPMIVLDKINDNPYILTSIRGIGFKKADEIAKAIGYEMTSPIRIDSALRYIIGEETSSGHCWVSFKPLLNKALDLLNISKTYIEDRLFNGAEGIKVIDERYTTDKIYNAEVFVSQSIIQHKSRTKKLFKAEELDKFLDEYCERNNVELEENQRKFFHDWNENNILFLVGGGGMGKTYLQKIILELVDLKNYTCALLSPTGKASKVQSNFTGRQASTIHRKTGVFGEDEEATAQIHEDVIIVDETSMCDVFILSKLFGAIKNDNVRILFVGDDFQLPSVGVGNYLYDCIHSHCVKISTLKKVFRQDDGGILDIATKVRNGEKFLNDDEEGRIVHGKDCVMWLVDQDYVKDGVITNYKNTLKRFSQDDITILSPTNKGKLGTVALNKEIQKIANPPASNKKEKSFGKKDVVTYRVGDLVMNTINTYGVDTTNGGKADIFNGDTGRIIDIDDEGKIFIVKFDGINVKIKSNNVLNSLIHAWVTTIHKSQGSQYKVVIMIVDKSMKFQLNANLIYTGVTRAKQFLLLLGQAEAINHGISKFANMERRSFLQELLHTYNGYSNDLDEKFEKARLLKSEPKEDLFEEKNTDSGELEYF